MRSQTPTVCAIQAPLTRRGFLAWVTDAPALKGRPSVRRRDAAAKPVFLCPTNITCRQNACFMAGTWELQESQYSLWSGQTQNVRTPAKYLTLLLKRRVRNKLSSSIICE